MSEMVWEIEEAEKPKIEISKESDVSGDIKLSISFDLEGMTLTVGEWVFDCVTSELPETRTRQQIYRRLAVAVMDGNGLCTYGKGYGDNLPKLFKNFTSVMSITPSKFYKLVRDFQYKCWIDGLNQKVLWGCYGGGTFKRFIRIPQNFREVKPLLLQCMADGQENITPLVAAFKAPPHEIKKRVGKGAWKRLCKNSITRNSLLVAFRNREDIKDIIDVPSTIIKNASPRMLQLGIRVDASLYNTVARTAWENRVVCNTQAVNKIVNTIFDTVRMAGQVEEGYNSQWSYKRWQEEHDRMSKLVYAKKYSPNPFEHQMYKKVPHEVVTVYGVATLLNSPYLVKMEGEKMKHCVGGYVNSCAEGRYLVYHVVSDEGEESTLGIMFDSVHAPRIQQHYGYCNSSISEASKMVAVQTRVNISKAIMPKAVKGALA